MSYVSNLASELPPLPNKQKIGKLVLQPELEDEVEDQVPLVNICEPPALTHPKLDDFCTDAYTNVHNLHVEKNKILQFDEHAAK